MGTRARFLASRLATHPTSPSRVMGVNVFLRSCRPRERVPLWPWRAERGRSRSSNTSPLAPSELTGTSRRSRSTGAGRLCRPTYLTMQRRHGLKQLRHSRSLGTLHSGDGPLIEAAAVLIGRAREARRSVNTDGFEHIGDRGRHRWTSRDRLAQFLAARALATGAAAGPA